MYIIYLFSFVMVSRYHCTCYTFSDTYRHSDNELLLECRVRGNPTPIVSWLKDGSILQGDRYRQSYLDDGIYRLEIAAPNFSDNGRYTCRAMNDLRTEEISHVVQFDGNTFNQLCFLSYLVQKELRSLLATVKLSILNNFRTKMFSFKNETDKQRANVTKFSTTTSSPKVPKDHVSPVT